jgi:Spy/CpxP family protein refolding chaperone
MSPSKVNTMMTFGKVTAVGLPALLLTVAAFAQAPAPASPATAPLASIPGGKHSQSAHSLECSKEADTKGLHGKARKKFREACKKGQGKEAQ